MFKMFRKGLDKIKSAFKKAGAILGDKLRALFKGPINEETLEELEQLLYESDLGVKASVKLTEKIRHEYKRNPSLSGDQLIDILKEEIMQLINNQNIDIPEAEVGPTVILIVGVNGNGKTTSVAKLAKRYKEEGKKVLVVAADTFRAAAVDQLGVWAERAGVEIVKGAPNSDASAVVFDAITAAKARGSDIVLVDTAGRLHTKTDLMQELEKIKRTCHKVHPSSPHQTLLVLDATTGQNAVDQALIFHKYTPIDGLILTKLDGTAKGGIVVSIQQQMSIPVKLIGLGEGIDDLQPFNTQEFVSALFD